MIIKYIIINKNIIIIINNSLKKTSTKSALGISELGASFLNCLYIVLSSFVWTRGGRKEREEERGKGERRREEERGREREREKRKGEGVGVGEGEG